MRSVDITWAGGEHAFCLKIGELRALQDFCDAGPQHILQRLATGHWRVDDVVSTIRLGLEGGGMEKAEARELVRKHVEAGALAEFVMTAQAILMAALYGPEDDTIDPGEPTAGEATGSPADDGDSPASTEAAP